MVLLTEYRVGIRKSGFYFSWQSVIFCELLFPLFIDWLGRKLDQRGKVINLNIGLAIKFL